MGLAGKGHQVARKLKGGPGAAGNLGVVGHQLERPAEAPVRRHEPLVGPEAASGVALGPLEEVEGYPSGEGRLAKASGTERIAAAPSLTTGRSPRRRDER